MTAEVFAPPEAMSGVFTETAWAVIREAVAPLTGALGIQLPSLLPLPPDESQRLDIVVYNKLQEFFANIFAQGSVIWNASFLPTVDAITSNVQDLIPTQAEFISWIQQAFTTLNINTQQITDEIVFVIRNSLANAIQSAYSNLSNAAATITDPILSLLNTVSTDVDDVYNFMANNVIRAIVVAQQYAQSSFQAVRSLTTSFQYYIPQIFDKVINGLNFNFSQIADQLVPQVSQTLNAFITQATQIVNNLTPSITQAVQTLITQAIDTITQTAQSLAMGSQTAVNYALAQLSELETYISTEFKFWVGEEGEYIINSLRGPAVDVGLITGAVGGVALAVQSGFAQSEANNNIRYQDLVNRVENTCTCVFNSLAPAISDASKGYGDSLQSAIIKPASIAMLASLGGLGAVIGSVVSNPCGTFKAIETFTADVVNGLAGFAKSICIGCDKELPADLSAIIDRTMKSVLGVGGGLGLSMMASELIAPLKSLGMSRLAAYFWDMSDFKAVGGDVLRALNGASTVKPLVYGLNEFFRPEIPRTDDANTLLHKGIINEDEWRKIYQQHGLADAYIDQYYADVWTEPSDRVVLNLLDTQGVPVEWVDSKLRARGYNDADRYFLKLYAFNRRLSDEFNSVKTAYEAAYVKGYASEEEYRTALRTIGRSDAEIAWAILAAEQKAQTARLAEDIDILVQAFRAGKLSLDAFAENINGLGLDADKAQNIIDKEAARQKIRVAAIKAQAAKKLTVTQVFQGVKAGLISDADAQARLVDIGYTDADAALLLAIFHAGNEITGP